MDLGSLHPAWTWLAVLLAGGALGWVGVALLTRWLDARRPAPPPGVPSWAVPPPVVPPSARQPAAQKDGWPDTVMVSPAEAAAALAPAPAPALDEDDPPAPPPASVHLSPHLQGLSMLAQGHFEAAWNYLQQVPAADPESPGLMEPLERLAAAFEGGQRFDLARAVYERMADIDPNHRDLKPRLVRARGLAQSMLTHPPLQRPGTPAGNLPRTIGRFLIEREIGRGAMGTIYLAHDPNLAAPVALKTLALSREFEGPDLADARARFFREAEMAGRLEHPNIVHIFDTGEHDGLAYLAMELLHGTDLAAHAVPGRLLPVVAVLGIVAQVAEALAYAHTRGVTHRDVKPANVMVDFNAQTVKVMDFGIARVTDSARTRTGVVLGTPSFMSPEQLAGAKVDGRSDLYSLGVALFQLLTGQLPFANESMARLMRAIANDPAPDLRSLRPELPEALANVVALALEKRPEVRYADGRQMAADLRAIAMHLSDPAQAGHNPAQAAS